MVMSTVAVDETVFCAARPRLEYFLGFEVPSRVSLYFVPSSTSGLGFGSVLFLIVESALLSTVTSFDPCRKCWHVRPLSVLLSYLQG